MADKVDDKGFLQRWSTRKADAQADARDGGDAPVPDDAEAVPARDEQVPPADLPDIETLDADSDYTGFLGDNVAEDVAKLALRKLWRSDPVLANLDGLNDYDDDFSKVGMVGEAIKTAYRVGKGFLADEDDEQAASDVSEEGEEAAVEGEEATVEGEEDATEFHDVEFKKPS